MRLLHICFTLMCLLTAAMPLRAQQDNSLLPGTPTEAAIEDDIDFASLPSMDYRTARSYRIAAIRITGVHFLDSRALQNVSGLGVGQTVVIPGEEFNRVIDKYWNQGLFSDVKVIAEKIDGDEVYIRIHLTERPRLSDFRLEGVTRAAKKDLNDRLLIEKESQVSQNMLNIFHSTIKKYYEEKGYRGADIQLVQKADTTRENRVFVTAKVDPGHKNKIQEIHFAGSNDFTEKRLRRVLRKTKERGWNFFQNHKLTDEKFKEDKEKLAEFFSKHGYRDYVYLSDSVVLLPKKDRLALYIRLEEGDQYFYRDINWIGNTKYSTEMLSRVLDIWPGDVYDIKHLDKKLYTDRVSITSLFQNEGYMRANIQAVETRVENDSIDVELRVSEGVQYSINQVNITGNTTTNEHVARRELRVKPGDLFSREKIERDFQTLATLGHFAPEAINPVIDNDDASATVDITYELEEKANDQLELSIGYGASMFIGSVGFQFNNFSMRRIFEKGAWRPVPRGDGQQLNISFQTNGKYYRSYNISFMEPWLGGKKPNSFSVSLFHSKMTQRTSYFWYGGGDSDKFYKSTGVSVGLGHRLTWPDDYFQASASLTYQRYQVHEWTGGSYYSLPFQTGASNNIHLTLALTRSSVNAPFYPTSGSTFSVEAAFTPPWSALSGKNMEGLSTDELYKWIEYHKWKFKGQLYLGITSKLVLATHYELGYLGYYNKDIGYSPYEGFDMGGSGMQTYQLYGIEIVSLRGYDDSSVTPYSANKQYRSGNMYTKANIEIRYPFLMENSAQVFGIGFIEAGNAWSEAERFNPFDLKRAAGFGVRAFLPMFGILGVEWGYGFDEVPGGPKCRGSQFQFTIGQQF